ncbi:MAG: Asd/ArgC dimerization domain-containing protein [Phycisphaerales bacterium]
MKIAVIGARGLVGSACIQELEARGATALPLNQSDALPDNADGAIIASHTSGQLFNIPFVDCSGTLEETSLVLPAIREINTKRMRIPNCMASLIAQALAPLHAQCKLISILATCMQSVSGAGWRGIEALKQNSTEEFFGGKLLHNILPHEKATQEERAIKNDLRELFSCEVSATSFRVPVFVGHIASIRIETTNSIDASLLPESPVFDPRALENKREVALGRVRIQKNTADLVICGDQLTCGTAVPAVSLILST